jgi:hypothetical protein
MLCGPSLGGAHHNSPPRSLRDTLHGMRTTVYATCNLPRHVEKASRAVQVERAEPVPRSWSKHHTQKFTTFTYSAKCCVSQRRDGAKAAVSLSPAVDRVLRASAGPPQCLLGPQSSATLRERAYSAEGPGNSRPGRFHLEGASQVGTPVVGRTWSRLSKCCHVEPQLQ